MTVLKRKLGEEKGGWSPARRAAQALRLRTAKIWTRATGPRSASGKARAAQNSFRHGRYSAAAKGARHRLVVASRAMTRMGNLMQIHSRLTLRSLRNGTPLPDHAHDLPQMIEKLGADVHRSLDEWEKLIRLC